MFSADSSLSTETLISSSVFEALQLVFTAGHPQNDSLVRNAFAVDGSLALEEALFWSQKVVPCGSANPSQQLCACTTKVPFPGCERASQLLKDVSSSLGDAAEMASATTTAGAAQTLLPLAGCSQCWQHCSREYQLELGQAGAVERLVDELRSLVAGQHQHQQQQAGLSGVLQALLFTCCGHSSNLQQLVSLGAVQQLAQVLVRPRGGCSSHDVQLCCCLLGEAAAAAGPSQLTSCLDALQRAAAEQQQLLVGSRAHESCSSCCALIWATSKAAAALCSASDRDATDSSSGRQLTGTVQQLVEALLLPLLRAAVKAAADAAVCSQQQQQQQRFVLLLILCLSCCAQLSQWCAVQQLPGQPSHTEAWTSSVEGALQELCPGNLQQVVQAYWQSLQQHTSSSSSSPSEGGTTAQEPHQHGLMHLSSCQLLSVLQQLQDVPPSGLPASSNTPLRPLAVTCVPAGATATIEVVYAGSPASEKAASSCDDKDLPAAVTGRKAKARLSCSSGSSRERSPSDDSSCRTAGHPEHTLDAAAYPHVQQQQLVEQPAVAQRHEAQQHEQQAPSTSAQQQGNEEPIALVQTADSALDAAEKQPGLQRQSRSVSSLCRTFGGADASSSSGSVSTVGTLPPRSELCSSASSNSIQARGDGQSGTTSGAGRADDTEGGQGGSNTGSSSSGGGGDTSRGMDSGSSHGSGERSSGGSGGSGNSGGDDDRQGDDRHDPPACTSPPSDDTAAAAAALSTSSDSIILSPMAGISAAPSAAMAAADAPVSLGCSASDPVIVPRPSALGTLPGLMLRGSPASLGPAPGTPSSVSGLGAPGTPPAASSSPTFSFPTNLATLNIGGQSMGTGGGTGAFTPGGLADVLLSPSAFGARGLLGQQGSGGLAGPGFGAFAGAAGRRASDAGALGASSGMLGSWGSGLNPQHALAGQPATMPVGSWPSAASGLSALEEHMQGQQQRQQQQQQGMAGAPGLPPAAAAAPAAPGNPVLERRALSGYLHMLNPGLMGLIGSTDTAGALGPVSSSTHLMSWLTEPASGLSSAGSGPTGAPVRPASAAATASEDHTTTRGAAGPSSQAAAASSGSQAAGALSPQSSCGLQGTTTGSSADGAQDVGPQRDQRPASGAAAVPKPASGSPSSNTAAGTPAKVLSGPSVLQPAAAGAGGASGTIALATAGSGSISSSGSFAGSGFSGIVHSNSGESLEDLESMRLSSASFAAALAEAEAIAANVAASMAAAQQQQQAVQVQSPGAPRPGDGAAAADSSALPEDASADVSSGAVSSSSAAYDPAELTKGAPSRHLWLGNLHQRLPRSLLRSTFEKFGPVEDVVTFPGRMYAFVNFREAADAAKAAQAVQDKEVPPITGTRRLVVKFRPSRRALGKVAEAMVPGLVDPASASNSDRGSAPSSHAGSCSNLAGQAALAAAGPPAGSRTSSTHSLPVLGTAAGMGASVLARAGSEPAPDDAASIRSGISSTVGAGGAGSSRDLARSGSFMSSTSATAPDLPPGLTPRMSLSQADDSAVGSGMDAAGRPAGAAAAAAAAAAGNISSAAAAAAAVAAAAAAVASGSSDSNAAAAAHVAAAAAALAAVDAGLPQGPGISGSELSAGDDVDIPEGRPSRHLWLGNIPLKPNRGAMEALFSRFGPLESVRVFPGKTFAFVNFVHANHAIAAKAALDGQPSPLITGPKPMVIRFQKDHAGAPPGTAAAKALEVAAARARKVAAPRTSLTGLGGLLAPTATGSLGGLGEEDLVAEPAVNLSNKLNPNNIHYDRELAARYKRMSKAEKEALWAQDRALQQLEQNPAAASLLSAAAAAAAAAAAGQSPSLGAFDPGLQGNPAAAAAAASSLYNQLLANPQLAAALAAQGNPAAAAAAAGLLQQSPSLAAGGPTSWGAMGTGALGPAGLGANNAAAAAAAAAVAAAAGRMGGYYGQMGGLAGAGGGGGPLQGTSLQQYLAAGGLSNQVLQQALLQQQLASGYTGLPGTPQEQATLAALSALDPSMLQTHLASGLAQHALGPRLSGMGSGLSMQSSQQQQPGLPSTPSVGAGAGVASLLGMPPNSPGPNMGRYSSTGVGFGAAAGLAGQGAPRGSYTGGGLTDQAGAGFQQFRASSSGSSLLANPAGGLGPIGPTGREGLFMDYGQQQQQHQQQQGGLLSPSWSGMSSRGGPFSGGGGGAPAPQQWPQHFICPLSNQLMTDPVVAADGVSYQREAITDWMRLRDVSPVTGQQLGSGVLQANFALRAAIAAEVAKVQSTGGLV